MSVSRYATLTEGLEFPEGPVALSDGRILVVEIAGERLTCISPDGTKTTVAELPGGPNGAAIGPDGAAYICNNGGFKWTRAADGTLKQAGQPENFEGGWIERVDLSTGEVSRLYTEVNGARLNGPNDIVFDTQGGFWFTDFGKTRTRDTDLGGVYYARPDGSQIVEAAFPFLGANGIALSPDESELYVAETATGRLWAFPVEGPGRLTKGTWGSPTGGRLVCGLPGFQRYDSIAVEANGNIAIATLRFGGITVVAPSGELVERITFDDPYTTNICFGGPDMCTAFITLSATGRLVRCEWARPGLTLAYQDQA